MKKYLRVMSLIDNIEQNRESMPSSSSFVNLQFQLSFATSQLIGELCHALGWSSSPVVPNENPVIGGSIFVPSIQRSFDLSSSKASKYKRKSDFPNKDAYGEYVKSVLEPGMRATMLEDYESVSTGDVGEFKKSNDGTPPAQFLWDDYGDTYWVFWHMVELIDSTAATATDSSSSPLEGNEMGIQIMICLYLFMINSNLLGFVGKAARLPYGLFGREQQRANSVCRDHWWEVLGMLKLLPQDLQETICQKIGEMTDSPVRDCTLVWCQNELAFFLSRPLRIWTISSNRISSLTSFPA